MSCNRRFACFGQVRFHCFERLQPALPVGFGHASQCRAAGNIAALTDLFQFGVYCLHEMEKPCAAVGWMWVPFD
jgi:hypothetical protein